MKAAFYEKLGKAGDVIQIGELPTPVPGPGEVRVRLRSSGVNPSDVKARGGERGSLAYPYVIPHSDGAGVIDSTGQGVSEARIGERVWTWNAAWRRAHGTCAQFVCLPAEQAVLLPSNVDFDEGACIGIPALTACHAALGDGPLGGKVVLVTGGSGAVGNCAIQLAKWSGAQVLATVSSAEKASHAKAAGADYVINYREQEVVAEVKNWTGGRGVDRIVEVEFGENLAVSTQILKAGGVIAAYGSAGNPAPQLPFYPLLLSHVTVHFMLVYILSPSQHEQARIAVSRALESRALRIEIGARYSLEETARAHVAVENRTVVGNVVVTIP
jgi:NADPH:quinone reductase